MPAFIPQKGGIISLATGPCPNCKRPAFEAMFVVMLVDEGEGLLVAQAVDLTPITFIVAGFDENGNITVYNSGQMPELQHMFTEPPPGFENADEDDG